MRRSTLIVLSALILFCIPPDAANAQNAAEDLVKDCSGEIKEYCSSVKPGEGRVISCMKAHQDKLPPNCAYAMNRASYWLDYLERTVAYIGSQCEADVKKFCSDVTPGGERIINCLRTNKAGLSKYCGLALKDIGKD